MCLGGSFRVAFILTFYILSLVLDRECLDCLECMAMRLADIPLPCFRQPSVWPAGKTSPRYLRRLARWQEHNEPHNLEHDFTGRQAFSTYPERWQGADGRALPVDHHHAHGGTGHAGMVDAYPPPPMSSVNNANTALPLSATPHTFEGGYRESYDRSARPSTTYGSEAGLVRQHAV
jgi:hypothetical protein